MKQNLFLLLMVVILQSCSQTTDQKMEALGKQENAFGEKLLTLKNERLKNEISSFGQRIFQLKKFEIANLEVPEKSIYQSNPLLVLKDYASFTVLANHYLNAMIANKTDTSAYGALLKLVTPFEFPFQVQNKWSSLQFSNRTSAPITRESDPQSPDLEVMAIALENDFSTGISVSYSTNDKKRQPVSIIGESTVLLPGSILEFNFSRQDIGQTKTQHGIQVKLLNIKDHIVKVEVKDALKTDARLDLEKTTRYKIIAKDQTSGFLADKENVIGPEESMKAYLGLIDEFIANPKSFSNFDKKLDDTEKKLKEKYKGTYFNTAYFIGVVEAVTVYVFDYSKATSLKKALNIPVSDFDGTFKQKAIAEIPTSATIYDHEAAALLHHKTELSETELNAQLDIIKTPLLASSAPNFEVPARISFKYPEVLSRLFLADTSRFDGFRSVRFFHKKGEKPLTIPKDATNLENGKPYQNQPWEETSNSEIIYDPRKFPSAFNFVSGIIKVKRAEIEKHSYKINDLPAGMKVNGNQFITNNTLFKAHNNRYFVKDKTGRYLKQITSATYTSADEKGTTYNVHYYYGIPDEIERVESLGIRKIDHPFEVEFK